METLMINQADLYAFLPLSQNTDFKWFGNSIEEVQLFYIKTALGDDLYTEIVTEIANNTVTALNQVIIDKLKPAIANYVMYVALPTFAYRIENTGVRVNTDDSSNPVSSGELSILRKEYRNKGEAYLTTVLNYLRANSSSYPLYANTVANVYTSNIFIPNAKRCGSCGK